MRSVNGATSTWSATASRIPPPYRSDKAARDQRYAEYEVQWQGAVDPNHFDPRAFVFRDRAGAQSGLGAGVSSRGRHRIDYRERAGKDPLSVAWHRQIRGRRPTA